MNRAVSADHCSCMEVYGENPTCALHGVGTDHWAEGIVSSPLEREVAAAKVKLHGELVMALRALTASRTPVHPDDHLMDCARAVLANVDALL